MPSFVWKLFGWVCRLLLYCVLSVPTLILTWLLYMEIRNAYYDRKYSDLPLYNEKYVYEKRTAEEKYLVLIGVESINLAETTRMLLIADSLMKYYHELVDVKFFHYGGAGSFKYDHLLYETNYDVIKLEPSWKTAEEIEYLYKVDRGEVIDDLIQPEHFQQRIENELDLYQKLRPNIIVSGFVLSAKLSCQIANVPYYLTMPIMYLDFEYFLSFLPKSITSTLNFYVNQVIIFIMRRISYLANISLETSLKFNVFPKIRSILQILEGDVTLVTEVPETIGWTQEQLSSIYGSHYVYVGSLFAKIRKKIPDDLELRINETIKSGQRILWFAMGSSGKTEIVINILKELDRKFKLGELNTIGLVISPTLRLINKFGEEKYHDFILSLDKKIFLTQPNLPADLINEICDLGIIHGGQGTVQTAVSSGMPFIGVPAQAEQKINIEHIVHHGSALIISKSSAMENGKEVVKELEYMIENYEVFEEKAKELQKVYKKYDAPKIIADLIIKEITK